MPENKRAMKNDTAVVSDGTGMATGPDGTGTGPGKFFKSCICSVWFSPSRVHCSLRKERVAMDRGTSSG